MKRLLLLRFHCYACNRCVGGLDLTSGCVEVRVGAGEVGAPQQEMKWVRGGGGGWRGEVEGGVGWGGEGCGGGGGGGGGEEGGDGEGSRRRM